jgi:hypothetical protein
MVDTDMVMAITGELDSAAMEITVVTAIMEEFQITNKIVQ